MHRNLKAEMIRANLSVKKLAMLLGITERSLRNKINGKTEFSLNEALKVRNTISPSMGLEELFEKDEKIA